MTIIVSIIGRMGWLTLLLIAVGLAMDCFAVSLGIGAAGKAQTPRPVFRVSFHMGLFQGLMTLIGWAAGSTVAASISQVDHWIAMILLAFVGVRMIRSGLNPEAEAQKDDPSRGGSLVLISIATSIDAMAVGLSLALLKTEILGPSLVIGLVSLGLGAIGLLIGSRLNNRFGKRMEIIGGLLLNGIGLRILLTHI